MDSWELGTATIEDRLHRNQNIPHSWGDGHDSPRVPQRIRVRPPRRAHATSRLSTAALQLSVKSETSIWSNLPRYGGFNARGQREQLAATNWTVATYIWFRQFLPKQTPHFLPANSHVSSLQSWRQATPGFAPRCSWPSSVGHVRSRFPQSEAIETPGHRQGHLAVTECVLRESHGLL